MKKFLPFIIIGAVFIVAVLFVVALVTGIFFVRSEQSPAGSNANSSSPAFNSSTSNSSTSSTSNSSAPSSSAPSGPVASGAVPPQVQGEPTAAVTLEEFGDFQCPPCGGLHPVLKQLEKDYSNARVRLIFRELPLTQIHKHAMEAARAAEAAGLQGKFWEMHDMIYEHQPEWAVMPDAQSIFSGYARSLDLDLEKWTRDMNSEAVNQRIMADAARADSLGVKGTPTLFINDREVPVESMTPAGIRATVDAALQANSK